MVGVIMICFEELLTNTISVFSYLKFILIQCCNFGPFTNNSSILIAKQIITRFEKPFYRNSFIFE